MITQLVRGRQALESRLASDSTHSYVCVHVVLGTCTCVGAWEWRQTGKSGGWKSGGRAGKSGGRMLLIFIICRGESFTMRIDWRDSV